MKLRILPPTLTDIYTLWYLCFVHRQISSILSNMHNWVYWISWIISVQHCSGLKCYSCGTESAHEINQSSTDPTDIAAHSGSCHDFETKIIYPIREYVVNCGDDLDHPSYSSSSDPSTEETFATKPMCVKFVSRSVHTDKFYTQRSCTSATTRTGKSHRLGCGPTMMNRDESMTNGIGGGMSNNADASGGNSGVFNISLVEHICFCDTDYCNQSLSLHFQSRKCGFFVFVALAIVLHLYHLHTT